MSQKSRFHPVVRAAIALSGLGRVGAKRNLLRTPDAKRLRECLLRGSFSSEDIVAFGKVLPSYSAELAQFGFDYRGLSTADASDVVLDVHASGENLFVQGGMHAGRTLAWMARFDRPYLFRLAADPWCADELVPRACMQALLGVVVTESPAGWGEPPFYITRARPAVGRSPSGDPIEPAERSGLVLSVEAASDSPDVRGSEPVAEPWQDPVEPQVIHIEREGDCLRLSFPYDKNLVSLCQQFPGGEFDRESRTWSLPLEAAVKLAEKPHVLASAPELLNELAKRYAAVVGAREGMRETIKDRQVAPARDIASAHLQRFVIRAPHKAGKVLCVFEYNEEIGNWLLLKVGGRYSKKEKGYLFDERDLVVVAEGLWRAGFVFEDVLIDSVRESKRLLRFAADRARNFSHPLKGAADAPLEYVAANGREPWPFQKADILYGLDCLRSNGGVGKWLQMGTGKAQSLDSKILTPRGWVRMGDIKVGDLVIGSAGRACRVTGVYPQGMKEMYRIRFSDGSATECCEEHLWVVQSQNGPGASRQSSVRALGNILDEDTVSGRVEPGLGIPLVAPVEFAAAGKRAGGDPYAMGRVLASQHCMGLRQARNRSRRGIPERYLLASVPDRVALLQGLLDGSGEVTSDSGVLISSPTRVFRDGIRAVVQSLGGTAYLVKHRNDRSRGVLHGATGSAYALRIQLPREIAPFRLAHKVREYNRASWVAPCREIARIENVGRKQAQCIRVDAPDSLYVTDDFIITHNTTEAAAEFDLLRREIPGLRALILAPRSAYSAWRREMRGMLPAEMFYGRLKTGPLGRSAMIEALAREDRGPIGVIATGSKKAREEALAAGPDIVIMNYDSARSTTEPLREWVRSGGPVLMICDESQFIADPTTQNAEVVVQLLEYPQISGEGGGRIALSGTPLGKSVNIYMQSVFIDGGFEKCRFGPSYRAFIERYFFVDKWGRVKKFKSSALEKEFMELVGFCTVRRTSAEAQDLPDLVYSLWEAEYEGGLEQAGYQWLVDLTQQQVEEGLGQDDGQIDMARISLRMRQWESHPGNIWFAYREALEYFENWQEETAGWRAERDKLLAKGASNGSWQCSKIVATLENSGIAEEDALARSRYLSVVIKDPEYRNTTSEALREAIELQKKIDQVKIKNDDLLAMPEDIRVGLKKFVEEERLPVKLQSLLGYVEEALGDPEAKVIIACDFDYTEQAIAKALKSYNPIWYQSKLNDEQRAMLEDAFQQDPSRRIFLGKAKTIHTGLTLTAARHMALYDAACSYDTVVWEQVQKRHHRGEQTQKCTVDHFAVSETIGPYALARVVSRAKTASRLLQDTISSLPASLQDMIKGGNAPSGKGDILSIFGALRGGA